MEKDIRRLLISSLFKKAQAEEGDGFVEDTGDLESDVSFVPYDESQFGNHEVFMEDFQTQFRPKDVNQAIEMSDKEEWITIPEEARRKGIQHLYYLDPAKASIYEKYFGVKTPYGYLHTPATAALQAAILGPGSVKRYGMAPMVEVPTDYSGLPSGLRVMVLDPQAEKAVVRHSERILERAGGRPEHIRRVEVGPEGEGRFTATHERGVHEAPGEEPISEDVESKMTHLERAISRFYDEDKEGEQSLQRLHSTVSRIKQLLDSRMPKLLSEQRDKNRAIRFDFPKEESDDVIKQALFRILIEELTTSGGPFEGVEIGLSKRHSIK